jgi:cytochrome c
VFHHRHASIVLLLALVVTGCEGARNNSSWSTATAGEAIVPALTKTSGKENAPTATAADTGRGVGPVDHVDIASLDGARALTGSQLFATKCSACHKLAERYIGPALTGVTQRRKPEWILNMILNPEKMIQEDATAKALLAEYLAPMANQSLTRPEAESILAYFLQNDAGATAPAEAKAGEASPAVTSP